MRTCSAGFLIADNRVLLARRSASRQFYPDVWDAVGGHVELGESVEAALVREIEEEIGVRALTWQFLAVLKEPNLEIYGPGRCHVFVVTTWDGDPHLVGGEHSTLRWFGLGEVRALRLADPSYVALLARVLTDGGDDSCH